MPGAESPISDRELLLGLCDMLRMLTNVNIPAPKIADMIERILGARG